MIAQLIEQGYFIEKTSEGRKVYILKTPVQVIVPALILKQLQAIFPKHEETGGILYGLPKNGSIIIQGFKQLTNTLNATQRKTGFRPQDAGVYSSLAVASGFLPFRFHSHPVSIYESLYDKQPLSFFQKTSSADRHNSYVPLSIQGFSVVLPDGLLSANDRSATDIRFYLYGGLIAPDSFSALLSNEKIYIYFSLAAVFLAYVFGSKRYAWAIFLLAAIFSVIVFVAEKRPSGVKNADGDLIISIS